jgi:hypothetical protein
MLSLPRPRRPPWCDAYLLLAWMGAVHHGGGRRPLPSTIKIKIKITITTSKGR